MLFDLRFALILKEVMWFVTYMAIVVAFLEAFEVVLVPLTSTINKPLTSRRAFVVKVPDEVSSTGSCFFRQVAH